MPSVFISGASGCVGHYLVDEFSPDYELYLLVRNPAKLRFNPATRVNITVIQGDLDDISAQARIIARMDFCLHVATAWGGEEAERINVERSHELFRLVDPQRIQRIIYFSTASILGRGNRILPEAERHGTDYIKTKYRCYMGLPDCPPADRIVTVFPTLVFGGDAEHPYSHLSSGLPFLRRYAWLLGRINVDVAFHFIHARDIARIVRHLIELPQTDPNYVLGNEPITLGEFTRRAAACFGHRINWQLPLSIRALYRLASVAGAKMSAWDRFCLGYGDFRYRTISCPSLGLPSNHDTVEKILADWQHRKG